MTQPADPLRSFRRGAAIEAAAAAALALGVAFWAIRVPVVSATPPTPATVQDAPAATAIDPAAWDVDLRRPADGTRPAAGPAPTALKLYSILQQPDGPTAAIAAGDGAMLYLRSGENGPGFTVLRVEGDGVVLRIDGREQRLGLGP
jgi:hypothetical protein